MKTSLVLSRGLPGMLASTFAIGVSASLASPGTAMAYEGAVVTRPYVVRERTEITGPNRALLHTGFWTLGLAYVPAVIVAAGSNREGDKNLYIPVAGPWMDLAMRGECATTVSCNNETMNKVLIVVDGIFQGIGALDIVGAFIFPETRTLTVGSWQPNVAHLTTPSFRLRPVVWGTGAHGLAAVGTF